MGLELKGQLWKGVASLKAKIIGIFGVLQERDDYGARRLAAHGMNRTGYCLNVLTRIFLTSDVDVDVSSFLFSLRLVDSPMSFGVERTCPVIARSVSRAHKSVSVLLYIF